MLADTIFKTEEKPEVDHIVTLIRGGKRKAAGHHAPRYSKCKFRNCNRKRGDVMREGGAISSERYSRDWSNAESNK